MVTVVIGAGVIGTILAYELQKRGRDVTLLDKGEPGIGASFGNVASIAVTEFMPASRPSVWRQIPGWMARPDGAVRVRVSYVPKLIPWFARFIAASRPAKLRQLEDQGAALTLRALEDFAALLKETGLQDQMSETGCLCLYKDDAEFRSDREHIDILERYGFPHHRLTGNEARDLEPDLSSEIGMAVLLPQNRSMKSPHGFVAAMAERFKTLGGRIEMGEVVDLVRSESIREVVLEDGRRIAADEVVIAAGAYSAGLSRMLREPIPLETERGYHTQIMAPGVSLRYSLLWPARAFMVTPTAGGIRVGGTVEMAGLKAPPDYRRSKATVRHAQVALPGLRLEQATEWMGHRPATPDTVPIMSRSLKTEGVFYATGHGHLGLTLSATCARLMGDLITGVKPPIDMWPYRVDRF